MVKSKDVFFFFYEQKAMNHTKTQLNDTKASDQVKDDRTIHKNPDKND